MILLLLNDLFLFSLFDFPTHLIEADAFSECCCLLSSAVLYIQKAVAEDYVESGLADVPNGRDARQLIHSYYQCDTG